MTSLNTNTKRQNGSSIAIAIANDSDTDSISPESCIKNVITHVDAYINDDESDASSTMMRDRGSVYSDCSLFDPETFMEHRDTIVAMQKFGLFDADGGIGGDRDADADADALPAVAVSYSNPYINANDYAKGNANDDIEMGCSDSGSVAGSGSDAGSGSVAGSGSDAGSYVGSDSGSGSGPRSGRSVGSDSSDVSRSSDSGTVSDSDSDEEGLNAPLVADVPGSSRTAPNRNKKVKASFQKEKQQQMKANDKKANGKAGCTGRIIAISVVVVVLMAAVFAVICCSCCCKQGEEGGSDSKGKQSNKDLADNITAVNENEEGDDEMAVANGLLDEGEIGADANANDEEEVEKNQDDIITINSAEDHSGEIEIPNGGQTLKLGKKGGKKSAQKVEKDKSGNPIKLEVKSAGGQIGDQSVGQSGDSKVEEDGFGNFFKSDKDGNRILCDKEGKPFKGANDNKQIQIDEFGNFFQKGVNGSRIFCSQVGEPIKDEDGNQINVDEFGNLFKFDKDDRIKCDTDGNAILGENNEPIKLDEHDKGVSGEEVDAVNREKGTTGVLAGNQSFHFAPVLSTFNQSTSPTQNFNTPPVNQNTNPNSGQEEVVESEEKKTIEGEAAFCQEEPPFMQTSKILQTRNQHENKEDAQQPDVKQRDEQSKKDREGQQQSGIGDKFQKKPIKTNSEIKIQFSKNWVSEKLKNIITQAKIKKLLSGESDFFKLQVIQSKAVWKFKVNEKVKKNVKVLAVSKLSVINIEGGPRVCQNSQGQLIPWLFMVTDDGIFNLNTGAKIKQEDIFFVQQFIDFGLPIVKKKFPKRTGKQVEQTHKDLRLPFIRIYAKSLSDYEQMTLEQIEWSRSFKVRDLKYSLMVEQVDKTGDSEKEYKIFLDGLQEMLGLSKAQREEFKPTKKNPTTDLGNRRIDGEFFKKKTA